MKNVTASMQFILDHARTRGESMASIPTDKLAELVDHLRALDKVVIAAEDFIANYDWWQEDPVDRGGPDRDDLLTALRAVAS